MRRNVSWCHCLLEIFLWTPQSRHFDNYHSQEVYLLTDNKLRHFRTCGIWDNNNILINIYSNNNISIFHYYLLYCYYNINFRVLDFLCGVGARTHVENVPWTKYTDIHVSFSPTLDIVCVYATTGNNVIFYTIITILLLLLLLIIIIIIRIIERSFFSI